MSVPMIAPSTASVTGDTRDTQQISLPPTKRTTPPLPVPPIRTFTPEEKSNKGWHAFNFYYYLFNGWVKID
jgi:hypothetical protein